MATPPAPMGLDSNAGSRDNSTDRPGQQQQRFSTPPPAGNFSSPKAGVKPLNPSAFAHDPTGHQHHAGSNNGGGGAFGGFQEEQVSTPVPQPFPMGSDSPWAGSPMAQQQQQQQQQAMSPSGFTEMEYHHTRNLISVVQRPALVAVLQSIMDDFPQLAPLIRVRCEKAMSVVMQQQQQQQQQQMNMQSPGSHVSPQQQQGGPGQQQQPGWGGQGVPPHAMPQNGDLLTPPKQSPLAGGRRGSRGVISEEQMMCGVHGNLRASKHLKFNNNSRNYECIPGFHCLENSREASTVPSAVVSTSATPTKKEQKHERSNSTGGGGLLSNPTQPVFGAANSSHGIGTPPPGVPYLNAGGAPNTTAGDVDVAKLEDLLSNLRRQ